LKNKLTVIVKEVKGLNLKMAKQVE